MFSWLYTFSDSFALSDSSSFLCGLREGVEGVQETLCQACGKGGTRIFVLVQEVLRLDGVDWQALRSTTVNFDDKAVCLVQPWLAKTDRLLAACQTATEAVDDQMNYCSLVWGGEERLLQS